MTAKSKTIRQIASRRGRAKKVLLAWQGWQMTMPDHWRPLEFHGHWKRGDVTIGDGEAVILQIKWWRPGKRFAAKAAKWLQRRASSVRDVKHDTDSGGASPDAPAGFEPVQWVAHAKGPRKKSRAIWYGWQGSVGLLFEVVVNRSVSAKSWRKVIREVIPSLGSAVGPNGIIWSLFGVSFVIPEGFRLRQKHLYLGDIALCFTRKRQRLMVRQLLPGELALQRRPMERWLSQWPFESVWRFGQAAQPWSLSCGDELLDGAIRQGRKRWRFPLGWLIKRHATAAGVYDTTKNRLLLCEWDAATPILESNINRQIQTMATDRVCDILTRQEAALHVS